MSRILVIGGYGGFGARISHRLAAGGHEVLVAGRSMRRAQAFCRADALLLPRQLDRKDIAVFLTAEQPDLVVDASGPFQAMDYSVPEACIAAGISYCDIADGRAFVCGIGALNGRAETCGVAILSGASSVPALSGAVVRALTVGVNRVRAIEITISASSQATAGSAVAAAILKQVGHPIQLQRGGRMELAHAWERLRRASFSVPGEASLRGRLVGLADVPDLELLPSRLPGEPAVAFYAGAEPAWQNIGLWLLGWLVRCGLIGRLSGLAGKLRRLQRLTRRGTGRSAMMVRLFCDLGSRQVERRWTLIASHGDGPEIPALSVPVLVDRILAGLEKPGARDAGQALSLADYEPAFRSLNIVHDTIEIPAPPPLYRMVMGAQFDALPQAVRNLHTVWRDGGASGEADVSASANVVGKLVSRLMRFPPPGRYPLHVSFREREGVEIWTRDFGGHCFSSCLSHAGKQLVERFGVLRFRFALPGSEQGLTMKMRGWSFCGIPLPLALAPRSRAREWEEEGRFWFDVPIALPLIGQIVHYRGWLNAIG